MKKLLLSAAVFGITAAAITAQTNTADPVVITVDGRDVPFSEFQYLYTKNNAQQLVPLTFDEYIDMFVNYKLKVADALANNLDTTASFISEFSKFRRELAEPYLADSTVYEALVAEAYGHSAEDVYVSHIMLPAQDPTARHRMDSLRTVILSGGATFEDVARQFSVDRASAAEGGRMGWVTAMSPYPWTFEKAAYETPVGQISEVVNSGIGYHLIRPEERRPAAGEVHVEHILLLTQGMDADAKAAVKTRIDSLYEVAIAPGANFQALASQFSQDPGSARNGGDLGWFGRGRMVAPFDSASFTLAVGEISTPVETNYGYHILHKVGQRSAKPMEEARPQIDALIARDPTRSAMPVQAKIDATAARLGVSIDPAYKAFVSSTFAASGNACDSLALATLRASDMPVFTVGTTTMTLSEAISDARIRPGADPVAVAEYVDRKVTNAFNEAITEYEIDELEVTEPAFRNLVNEYRDGILLFDISQREVWERASKDTKGIEKYFKKNKKKYATWDAPRFKSYIIFTNDSLIGPVQEYVMGKYGKKKLSQIDQQALIADLNEQYGRQVRVERVIAAKGENPITDYLGFGEEKPEPRNPNFKAYFALAPRLIDQPEEYLDVKSAVVADYQTALEADWIKKLRKKYKVTINREALEPLRSLEQ